MRTSAERTRTLRTLVALAVLFTAGAAAAVYVLLHERLSLPLRSTYEIHATLTAANGVVPGLGQPVNVAGVQAGSITGARDDGALADLTLQIDRDKVPRVYANADVTLAPVSPLGDVEIDLSPGAAPARALAPGGTVPVADTVSPVVLEDLLRNLDGDTRSWLGSLIASLGQGTAGRGQDIRAALAALGPSAAQVREIASALAVRRRDLAHLVHDLAVLTRAASSDRQLARLVPASSAAMHALATESVPLQQAIRLLPGSLGSLDRTLGHLRTFAGSLTPTLGALLPAVRGLPSALAALRPFTRAAAAALATHVRPFVAGVAPIVSELGPAAGALTRATPSLQSALQVAQYLTNETAYNPGGANQGYLYWLDWFFHNWNSVFSSGDANGVSPRADILANCNMLAAAGSTGTLIEGLLGLAKLC